MNHPAEAQQQWHLAEVARVYPDTWEIDAQLVNHGGSLLRRVHVMSHFLPEEHTAERMSRVMVGYSDLYQQGPVAIVVHNPIMPDDQKAAHVYWSEHLAWRQRIDRQGVFELANTRAQIFIRGEEEGPYWRLATPNCTVTLDDAGKLIEVDAENIHLGAGAAQQLVLGNLLMEYLNELVTIFNGHLHNPAGNAPITIAAGGTGPQPPFTPALLSEVSKTV